MMNNCESRTDSSNYQECNDLITEAEEMALADIRQAQIDGFIANWDMADKRYYDALLDIMENWRVALELKSMVSLTIQEQTIIGSMNVYKDHAIKYAEEAIDNGVVWWKW